MDGASVILVDTAQRRARSDRVGERPDTVLAIHAFASGTGRLWLEGTLTRRMRSSSSRRWSRVSPKVR